MAERRLPERRLIDQPPQDDESPLTTHVRRAAAPTAPLSSASQAKILARLQAPATPRQRVPALAWGVGLGAAAMLIGVAFGMRWQRPAPTLLVAEDRAKPEARAPSVVVVPPAPSVESDDDKPLVLTTGSLVVRSGPRPRLVETPFGNVTIEANSVVRVHVRSTHVEIAAWEGTATFVTETRRVPIASGAQWSSAARERTPEPSRAEPTAIELLAQVVKALRRDHDPQSALALLARYRALPTHAELAHEADLLEAEALVAAGHDEAARKLLDRLTLDERSDLARARDRLRRDHDGDSR